MKLNEIMVRELREEHRDREWVDKEGTHWMWCEDQWMVTGDTRWVTVAERRFHRPAVVSDAEQAVYAVKYPGAILSYVEDDDDPQKNRGPFMEGLYYAATRGRR